jgi:acyl carrier protein
VVANLDVERWLETANNRDEALFCEARFTKAGAVQPLKEPITLPAVPKNFAAPDSLRAELQALSGVSRQQRLSAVLQDFVAKILRTTASQRGQLALELPLTRLGLDSLMAVELRNRIDAELGVRVPLSLVMQNGTIRLISERVLQELPAAIEESAQSEVWEEGEL